MKPVTAAGNKTSGLEGVNTIKRPKYTTINKVPSTAWRKWAWRILSRSRGFSGV